MGVGLQDTGQFSQNWLTACVVLGMNGPLPIAEKTENLGKKDYWSVGYYFCFSRPKYFLLHKCAPANISF